MKRSRGVKKERRFTVEPGREIHLDGEPFIGIRREGNTSPVEADEVTHIIAKLLNEHFNSKG